jgi:Flp pilus assembly protein TadD
MRDNKTNVKEYESYIKEATLNLKQWDYDEAYKSIMNAMTTNPNLPEAQNLLGIWYEKYGNRDLARKHYRIAYVLNPRYKAASVNLERASSVFQYEDIPIDYGDEDDKHGLDVSDRRADTKIF